jgi:hypothetical protein
MGKIRIQAGQYSTVPSFARAATPSRDEALRRAGAFDQLRAEWYFASSKLRFFMVSFACIVIPSLA